jgi:hypothetical protein
MENKYEILERNREKIIYLVPENIMDQIRKTLAFLNKKSVKTQNIVSCSTGAGCQREIK